MNSNLILVARKRSNIATEYITKTHQAHYFWHPCFARNLFKLCQPLVQKQKATQLRNPKKKHTLAVWTTTTDYTDYTSTTTSMMRSRASHPFKKNVLSANPTDRLSASNRKRFYSERISWMWSCTRNSTKNDILVFNVHNNKVCLFIYFSRKQRAESPKRPKRPKHR